MAQPIHIKNACVWDGGKTAVRDLYMTDVVSESPLPNALTVDLKGYTIFPGLVNAHDHLELNHYPRTKFREVYENARQWSADVNARLDTSPYKELRAYPLEDKLFIGGLKNLLCGATTVAHHNPPHKPMFRKDFPVRVLRNYGWAHSLYLSSEAEIVRSYQNTPKEYPWFIHIAEGTDAEAAGEYQRLKALGCIGRNTVLIHGVGITPQDEEDAAGVALVLCPTTNKYLLNRFLNTETDLQTSAWTDCLVLGSDSRLTAEGDLLDEMRFAVNDVIDNGMALYIGNCGNAADCVLSMVTWRPSAILNMKEVGHLKFGAVADLIALKNTASQLDMAVQLCNAHRADLALVIKGGVPQIGDPEVMAQFPHIRTIPAMLDGKPKAIHIDLAHRISQCLLKESGLTLEAPVKQSLFGFLRR